MQLVTSTFSTRLPSSIRHQIGTIEESYELAAKKPLIWSHPSDSNRRPADYEPDLLTDLPLLTVSPQFYLLSILSAADLKSAGRNLHIETFHLQVCRKIRGPGPPQPPRLNAPPERVNGAGQGSCSIHEIRRSILAGAARL
jgi:hypothetical protein